MCGNSSGTNEFYKSIEGNYHRSCFNYMYLSLSRHTIIITKNKTIRIINKEIHFIGHQSIFNNKLLRIFIEPMKNRFFRSYSCRSSLDFIVRLIIIIIITDIFMHLFINVK